MKRKTANRLLLIAAILLVVCVGFAACSAKTDDKAAVAVTMSVDCKLLYDKDPERAELGGLSDKGVMVTDKKVAVGEGASVYAALVASGIQFTGNDYVAGIMGLAEGDGGPESGWCFLINGKFPEDGVKDAKVGDGDKIDFRYTLDYGKDISG